MEDTYQILTERRKQIFEKNSNSSAAGMECDKKSTAGSVSQRACVFCGSRVVLYPIADALHLVHGPAGCAAYTWDIRGSLSSGPELYRNSFTTDLRETEVIYGGEKKLEKCLCELIEKYNPAAAFIYSTCIIGIIGDDVAAVCRRTEKKYSIPVISVQSEGFRGTKKSGYKAACDALFNLIDRNSSLYKDKKEGINIVGEFNIAGEAWLIKSYYARLGINVVSTLTGDGRVAEIMKASGAALNLVQCSGSMTSLAEKMKKEYGIPYERISYFGIEDMSEAIYKAADFFKNSIPDVMEKAQELVKEELFFLIPELQKYKKALDGKTAAIYVGGAFKAFSLIKALRHLGMKVVLAGTQTGSAEEYEMLKDICDEGAIIVDDTNPVELSQFMIKKSVDLLIGGVKERPIAYKLGIAFCDHNHERKIPLAGYQGMLNFSKEVHDSVSSPVWKFAPRKSKDFSL